MITLAQAALWLKWSVIGAFAASIIFVVGMTCILPWWRALVTRSLIIADLCWAVTLAPLAGSELLHWNEGSIAWVCYYAVSLSLSCVVTIWRLWVMWHEQQRGRQQLKRLRKAADDQGERPKCPPA